MTYTQTEVMGKVNEISCFKRDTVTTKLTTFSQNPKQKCPALQFSHETSEA